MRRIVFMLIAVISLAVVPAYMAPHPDRPRKGHRTSSRASLRGARSNARSCRFQVARSCRWRR
jgi:hypothetical protein